MWIVEAILVELSGFQHGVEKEEVFRVSIEKDGYILRPIGGPNGLIH